jgi:hypothetical protein
VTVSGWAPNTFGIGTVIVLRSENEGDSVPSQLVRQIAVDHNFVSSNLLEAHFGVGDWQGPFELKVTWPDQQVSVHPGITRNSFVNLVQPPFDKIFSTRFE